MTASKAASRRLSVGFLALLAALLVAAALVGGYLDWIWWHPTKGITVTLAAGGLLLLAGVLALGRRPLTNRVALGIAAVGAGLLIGQAVGPSREAIALSAGTMTLRLDGPVASSASGPVDCQTVPSGEHLQVTGDVNTRLAVPDLDPTQAPTVVPSVSFGDMWAPETGRRPDEVVFALYANSAMVADDGSPTELWLRSTPSSTLAMERDGNSGRLSFTGLAVTEGEIRPVLGSDGEVTGTFEWICPG